VNGDPQLLQHLPQSQAFAIIEEKIRANTEEVLANSKQP
jgi:hypothetical protein